MANTYTQLYIQLIFAVQGRKSLLPRNHSADVHRYITGIVQNRKYKMLQINSEPDHIHIFIGLHPSQSIADLVKEIKTASNTYINNQSWMNYKFAWQIGYGAFSYSRKDLPFVSNYIAHQKEHHRKTSFRDEYISLLKDFEIEFKDEYLFEFIP